MNELSIQCLSCEDKSCATSALKEAELNLMGKNCCKVLFKAGEKIIHADTFSSHVPYIRKGLVKESVEFENRKERITRLIKQHHYLGLESVVADKVNNYNYTALEDTEVCLIERNVFRSLVRLNGNFAMEILISISKTNLYYVHHFIDFSEKQVSGKLSEILMYLSEVIYCSRKFTLHLSRKELAAMVYVSRESLIRTLRKFNNEGIIKIKGKNIEIINLALLEKIRKCG